MDAWVPTARDLARDDERDDATWYAVPRLLRYADDAALHALRLAYADLLAPLAAAAPERPLDVVDVGCSWVSHYPTDDVWIRGVGVGMNEDELVRNGALDEYYVRDLNAEPVLPLTSASVDAVTMAFCVQYWTSPLQLFHEALRALRPGGVVAVACSNRWWPEKVVAVWRDAADDAARGAIVARYLRLAGFVNVHVDDASPDPGRTDPLLVITGRKLGEGREDAVHRDSALS